MHAVSNYMSATIQNATKITVESHAPSLFRTLALYTSSPKFPPPFLLLLFQGSDAARKVTTVTTRTQLEL